MYKLADFVNTVGKISGVPKYDGTTYQFTESEAWSHCIAPLATYNVTYATTLTGKQDSNGGAAPILFLSSGTLAAENIVGYLFGDTFEPLTHDSFRIYDGTITPPATATHIVFCDFNTHATLGNATTLDELLKITVS